MAIILNRGTSGGGSGSAELPSPEPGCMRQLDGAGETAPTLSAALRKTAAAAHPTRGVATAIPHVALREAAANTNPPQRPPSGLSLTPYTQLSASNFHLESDLRSGIFLANFN